MRNNKAIVARALMVPALALTGGVAYASTTGSHPTPAQPAVTTTPERAHALPRRPPTIPGCAGRSAGSSGHLSPLGSCLL
jgi:hypothetical protein